MVRMYCSCWCSASAPCAATISRCCGVVEVGQARVVELEVGAAEVRDPAQLLGVRRGQVGPERLEVGVDVLVDRRPAAAVVHHARRRDGQLRGQPLGGLPHGLGEERERVAEDRLAERHLVVHPQRGGLEVQVALGVAEVHLQLLVGAADALELVDEVHVPRGTSQLAVRGRLQAGVALQADDLGDRLVLDLAQGVRVDLPGGVPGPGLEQRGRPQQAADVVGAERGTVIPGHRGASRRRWCRSPGPCPVGGAAMHVRILCLAALHPPRPSVRDYGRQVSTARRRTTVEGQDSRNCSP